nr:RluA family pseudouridine synthase [Prevotella sp.]
MNMIFRPLYVDESSGVEVPQTMNNPLCYQPHPLCILACKELQQELAKRDDWREEIDRGKMFGVLIVESPQKPERPGEDAVPRVGYMAAYSGQIGGKSDWEGFVPAVFDYLQPEGYFRRHEDEITGINKALRLMEGDERLAEMKKHIDSQKALRQQTIDAYQHEMRAAKAKRDARREQGDMSEEEEAEMVKESQFMKAQLRRLKKKLDRKDDVEVEYERRMKDISDKKLLRKELSDRLQRWLFGQFDMLNARGERKNLLEIFEDTASKIPPAGSGECCEPKLLQYAYEQGYRPLQMAMFWWGESPKEEIRHHLNFYPACNGKCKPILQWMLPEASCQRQEVCDAELATLYEDEQMAVVCKPAGMLSVPGKNGADSVFAVMRRRWPHATGPIIVHRLDMSTSGLMVVAKTEFAYHRLQEQFVGRQVEKRYVAIIGCHDKAAADSFAQEGTICLPIMPDYLDRPRQIVSREQGKEAVTEFRVISRIDDTHLRIALYPKTGRTHQLRVHCAHGEGLHAPIVGDPLYGNERARRLFLHAEAISLRHPLTGKQLFFESLADF